MQEYCPGNKSRSKGISSIYRTPAALFTSRVLYHVLLLTLSTMISTLGTQLYLFLFSLFLLMIISCLYLTSIAFSSHFIYLLASCSFIYNPFLSFISLHLLHLTYLFFSFLFLLSVLGVDGYNPSAPQYDIPDKG